MSTTASLDLRASSLKDCPRKAVAEGLGVDHREFTPGERRRMHRGKVAEEAYFRWLQDEHPGWTLERQKEIRWAHGTGHADCLAVEPGILFEVLSSGDPGGALIDAKLMQLVLYMLHCDEADSGLLVILDRDEEEDRIPVARGTDRFNAIAWTVHQRIAEIDKWAAGGELPGRVCSKPSDAIGHFCRAAAWCFDGWEPPPLDVIDNGDARRICAELTTVGEHRAHRAREDKVDKAKQKELEADLADHVPVGEHQVGNLWVRRTHVVMRPTIDAKKVEHAGLHVPDEFWKAGSEYEKWTLVRMTDEPIVTMDDYGDEAPF